MPTVGSQNDINLSISSLFVDDPNLSPRNYWGNHLQILLSPSWKKCSFRGKSDIIMKFWLIYKTSNSKSDFELLVHSMLKRFQKQVKQLKYSFSLRGFSDLRLPWLFKCPSEFLPENVVLGYKLKRKRFWVQKWFCGPIWWRKWLSRLFRMHWKCFGKVLDGLFLMQIFLVDVLTPPLEGV